MTTSKNDEEISTLNLPMKEQVVTVQANSPRPILSHQPVAVSGRKNLTQFCRIVGCGFIFFITWGVASSFSAYQAYYQEFLPGSHAPSTISWIGTVQVALLGMTGIVSGALYDRGYLRILLISGCSLVILGFFMLSLAKEYYQIILAQGVCIGLGKSTSNTALLLILILGPGNGMLYVPSVAVISQTFSTKSRPLAIGVSSSGAAIGGIVLPIMFRHLQPSIGFDWINRVFGFIVLAMSISTIFLLRPDSTHTRARGPLFDPSALKEPPYIALLVGLFFVFLGYWIPLIYITPYAQFSLKTSVSYAFYLLAILNAGSLAGRILPAFLAHRFGPAVILAAGCISLGILILAWIGIHNVAGITVWSILVGFMAGITVAIPAAVVPLLSPSASVVGARTGMAWSGAAFAALIGGPIAGALVDTKTNDYAHGEAFGGAVTLFGGLVLIYPAMTIAKKIKRHQKRPAPAEAESISVPVENDKAV